MAGVVNICPGCGKHIYDMEPCTQCGLTGAEVAAGGRKAKEKTKVKANEKLYVIMSVGWEYNDENYYRPESGGGDPVKAFRSQKKAERECDRLNGEWLRTEAKDMSFGEGFEGVPVGFEVVEVEEAE